MTKDGILGYEFDITLEIFAPLCIVLADFYRKSYSTLV
jgi:hypothetical protein